MAATTSVETSAVPAGSLRTLLALGRAAGLRKQPARPALNEEDEGDEHEDLAEHGAGVRLEKFVDDPIDMPPMSVPHKLPTPPKTTTMKESMMYDWPRFGPTFVS